MLVISTLKCASAQPHELACAHIILHPSCSLTRRHRHRRCCGCLFFTPHRAPLVSVHQTPRRRHSARERTLLCGTQPSHHKVFFVFSGVQVNTLAAAKIATKKTCALVSPRRRVPSFAFHSPAASGVLGTRGLCACAQQPTAINSSRRARPTQKCVHHSPHIETRVQSCHHRQPRALKLIKTACSIDGSHVNMHAGHTCTNIYERCGA